MIDKAEVFTAILIKNELRRSSGLPKLPVRDTYLKTVRDNAWREYLAENGSRVRAEVLAQQRLRYGREWPVSGGGWMAYSCLVAKALGDGFQAQRSP